MTLIYFTLNILTYLTLIILTYFVYNYIILLTCFNSKLYTYTHLIYLLFTYAHLFYTHHNHLFYVHQIDLLYNDLTDPFYTPLTDLLCTHHSIRLFDLLTSYKTALFPLTLKFTCITNISFNLHPLL